MGGRKGRQRKAAFGQSRHDWKRREIKLEEMRADDLACDRDISEPGLGAKSKRCRSAPGEQPLIGRKTLGRPMLAPLLDRMRIGTECPGEMIANARHHQWMGISDRHQRQRSRVSAFLRIGRHQSRFWLEVLDIFDDRERLGHAVSVMDEGWNDAFSIDGFVSRLELFARKDVDWRFLERQALEPERDPHPKRCNRSPKPVNLYTHTSSRPLNCLLGHIVLLPAQKIGLQSPYRRREYHTDQHQYDDGDHHARCLAARLRFDDK